MSATTTRTEIAVLLDVLFGGVVTKECCDDDLGVRLHGFAPRCACDVRTVEVIFPVLMSECHEPATWLEPGWRSLDIEFDRFRPTTIQVAYEGADAPFSCLLPAAARELFDAVSAASESLV